MSLARASAGVAAAVGWAGLAMAGYEVPNAAYNPPTHYYDAATGTGLTLRTNLHNIITSGFVGRSYGDSRYNMATESSTGASKASIDQDPNNPSNIILLYNRASIAGTWDAGATWNREHIWPKFWLDVTSSQVSNSYKGPASDAFELRPSNPGVNSSRSDSPYGFYPTVLGSYGNNSNGGTTYWYPGTPDTGDVARAIFYMATRYFDPTDPNRGTDIQNLDIKNGASTKFNMGDLNSLLHWNYSDGVDNFERRRNQYIYGSSGDLTNHALNPSYYQGNRNPFIDHPEYVWAVFGGGNNDSQLTVGLAAPDGSSSAAVNLGKVIVGAALPTGSVVLNKTGENPTTFDVTTGGSVAATAASSLQAGAGQPFDYGVGTKTMGVQITASTATAGVKSGTVTFNNTDLTSGGAGKGSADGNDVVTVSATVVDHSNASLAVGSDLNSRTIDFGYVPQGFASRSSDFIVTNLQAPSGFTAGLALNSVTTGGSSSFSTDATPFGNLAAGSVNSYSAIVSTATPGVLSATHTFAVSDESIPGATANTSLVLTTTARVISTASFPVSGSLFLGVGETYDTGAFSIADGVTLTQTGPGALNVTGSQANGAGSALVVDAGSATLATDGGANLNVSATSAGASVTLAATQHLASLTVGNAASAALTPGGDKVLVAGSLSITGTGTLDLADGDAILGGTTENTVRGLLSGGNIFSSSAAADAYHITGIGYAPASLLAGSFDGEPLDTSDVVLKYTYLGDANLDGSITSDDYALLDRGMALGLSDWTFGDFDYSGSVTHADYMLIDTAAGLQAGILSPALLADREARFGDAYVAGLIAAVPEPAVGTLMAAAALFAAAARRRPR